MKSIIVYTSVTGNTKRIAQSIHKGMKQLVERSDLVRIKDVDSRDLVDYDLVGFGSPSWRAAPPNVRHFIHTMPVLKGKHAFAFCTHGVAPELYFPLTVGLLVSKGLTVIGTRDWYASVILPLMPKPYPTDGHPDEIDLEQAEQFGREMVELSRRISVGGTQLIPTLPTILPADEPPATGRAPRPPLNLNTEKCKYPVCHLCVDNCILEAINLSVSPPIFPKGGCSCYLCEMICPEGAIEVDYDSFRKTRPPSDFVATAEANLDKAEAEGCFRRLVPKEDVDWNTPFYLTHNSHPRYVVSAD